MRRSERGTILVITLMVLAILSVLGGAALREALDEHGRVRRAQLVLMADALADAGIERALMWFTNPATAPPHRSPISGPCSPPGGFTTWAHKRCQGSPPTETFFLNGVSQFQGTADRPDVVYVWDAPLGSGPGLPSDPAIPSSRVSVKVFGPSSADAVATLLSQAVVAQDVVATVHAEVVSGPWSGIPGVLFTNNAHNGPFPTRVHWGEVFISGSWDAQSTWDQLPMRDANAPISGAPYAGQPTLDRWFGVSASGAIFAPVPSNSGVFPSPYQHIRGQEVIHRLGLWSYPALKRYAKKFGQYYETRGTGLLYAQGSGTGIPPSTVLGTTQGLVFIDTLDGKAPNAVNLDRLFLTLDHVRADAYVGAHVTLVGGQGRSVTVHSPDTSAPPVTLSDVHYVGALVVAGEAHIQHQFHMLGALSADQGFRDEGALEIWYDRSLAEGYRPGFAPVLVKPGSRRHVVSEIWAPG